MLIQTDERLVIYYVIVDASMPIVSILLNIPSVCSMLLFVNTLLLFFISSIIVLFCEYTVLTSFSVVCVGCAVDA